MPAPCTVYMKSGTIIEDVNEDRDDFHLRLNKFIENYMEASAEDEDPFITIHVLQHGTPASGHKKIYINAHSVEQIR